MKIVVSILFWMLMMHRLAGISFVNRTPPAPIEVLEMKESVAMLPYFHEQETLAEWAEGQCLSSWRIWSEAPDSEYVGLFFLVGRRDNLILYRKRWGMWHRIAFFDLPLAEKLMVADFGKHISISDAVDNREVARFYKENNSEASEELTAHLAVGAKSKIWGAKPEGAINVSILQLIVRPESYHDRAVTVSGSFSYGPEMCGWLYPDVGGLINDQNRIGVSIPDELRSSEQEFSGNRVTLSGYFSAVISEDGEVMDRLLLLEYVKMNGED